jgi:hypothetical protein
MTSILKVDTIQDTAGNNIINESGDTITIGASGDTVNVVGTLQNNGSGVIQGITMADQWRLSADTSVSATQSITTNWEKADNTNAGFIGSGMTESSGVFTFPSTGIYLINFQFTTESSAGGDTTISMVIQATTDNSSYSTVSKVDDSETTNRQTTGFLQYFFDVTSTTNCKVKFGVESYDAGILGGNTAFNKTSAYFIRLGDT